MILIFRENLNLQLPHIFYNSIRFVFETVFISEQIAENRFEALLEIIDKFITKFSVFSYMILQFKFKRVWKISKRYCERKILGMGKGTRIKHSVSSPLAKYGESFFIKMLCMGEQTFLGKFMGGCFTWGLMIGSSKGGS